jgi:MarC family membrane protein
MDILKSFISLLALINPVGAIPFFMSLTANQSDVERRRTIRIAAISVFCVIAVTTLLGQQIIGFFGISVGSLQVGGGIIMLLMAINMLNAQIGNSRSTPEERHEAEQKDNIAVVPLAIPLSRPTASCCPARARSATACASCATPACWRRCSTPPRASRCWACAWACRCCSITARSRTRRASA